MSVKEHPCVKMHRKKEVYYMNVPVGVIVDASSVLIGGLAGDLLKSHLSDSFKDNINLILGLSSMGMGVASIVLMKNMPAVIFALIIGTMIGLAVHLGDHINNAAVKMMGSMKTGGGDTALMVTAIVLFCASGTGIYGALVSGMDGDQSILISKAILDFFTAMIFACTLGKAASLVAVPQFLVLFLLFLLAGVIYPLTTPDMINDFKACGGFIMLATGFRMIKVKNFPIADMIPAMILVMPFSALWMMIF